MLKKNSPLTFRECLDTIQVIEKPVRENLGEDSFYCAEGNNSAVVSVFDGCGGLGARNYESYKGHTGAYIASRIVCSAVHDWYRDLNNREWRNFQEQAISLDQYILKAYEICESYAVESRKILGSMVRTFPTTMALAYAELHENLLLNIMWAGDSRVYLLDEDGLAQMTEDDTDVKDAFENLTSDGVMNNVLSSDGDYRINVRSLRLNRPGIIFAATDGCFGYFSSPMEFEYCILKGLIESETPEKFRQSFRKQLERYAGDDFTFAMMSFYYGTFANTRRQLKKRLNYIQLNYINPLERAQNSDMTRMLWNQYKKGYERYLK